MGTLDEMHSLDLLCVPGGNEGIEDHLQRIVSVFGWEEGLVDSSSVKPGLASSLAGACPLMEQLQSFASNPGCLSPAHVTRLEVQPLAATQQPVPAGSAGLHTAPMSFPSRRTDPTAISLGSLSHRSAPLGMAHGHAAATVGLETSLLSLLGTDNNPAHPAQAVSTHQQLQQGGHQLQQQQQGGSAGSWTQEGNSWTPQQANEMRHMILMQQQDCWSRGAAMQPHQQPQPQPQPQVLQPKAETTATTSASAGAALTATTAAPSFTAPSRTAWEEPGHAAEAMEVDSSQPRQQREQDPDQKEEQQELKKSKRGRPPKVPGQFSKGYLAIKRYRQRKKTMVETMEGEVQEKLEQMQSLTAENLQLVQRLKVLEGVMAFQDSLMSNFSVVQQSLTGGPTAAPATATAAAAARSGGSTGDTCGSDAEGLGPAAAAPTKCWPASPHPPSPGGPTSSNSSAWSMVAAGSCTPAGGNNNSLACCASSMPPPKAACQFGGELLAAASNSPRPRMQDGHTNQQELGAAAVMSQYRLYVQNCAGMVVAESHSTAGADDDDDAAADAAASAAGAKKWPVYPFSLRETLALWKLGLCPAMPGTGNPPAGLIDAGDATSNLLASLDNGMPEQVPASFWDLVSQQISLKPGQQQQLQEAWKIYGFSVQKLSEERQTLCKRLQAATSRLERGAAGLAPLAAMQHLSLCGDHTGLAEQLSLLSDVEESIVRGRVLVLVGGWALKSCFDDEQFAKLSVASWPHLPLVPAIVGHMLSRLSPEAV